MKALCLIPTHGGSKRFREKICSSSTVNLFNL